MSNAARKARKQQHRKALDALSTAGSKRTKAYKQAAADVEATAYVHTKPTERRVNYLDSTDAYLQRMLKGFGAGR